MFVQAVAFGERALILLRQPLAARHFISRSTSHKLQMNRFIASSSRLLSSKEAENKFKPHEINAKFTTDDPRMPAKQRLKNLFAVYGPTAVVLHIGLSLCFLGATYMVVRYGFDVPAFLQNHNLMNERYMTILANSGTFGLAYALYKAQMPFRVLVTLFLTPKVARQLQKYGVIKRKF